MYIILCIVLQYIYQYTTILPVVLAIMYVYRYGTVGIQYHSSTGLFGHEYGKTVWTEFTVFPYPIAFSDALSGFSSTSSHGVARCSVFGFPTVRD